MRSKRGLKPREEENFAINRPDAITEFIGTTFDIIGIAGWIIGSFSILVGGFGSQILCLFLLENEPTL